MSFEYEYAVVQQYEGWTANFSFRGQSQGLGSQVDVNRYEGNFKYLWNVSGFSPPLFVLGFRTQGITVDAQELDNVDANTLIPTEDRIFAGGDSNLRGFPRQSLNNGERGYLSFLYTGFELRLIEQLPWSLQPFLLLDFGKLSTKRYDLENPVYVSQGAGVRWVSPIGVLRGSYAQGLIWGDQDSENTYEEQDILFLSFGQEF